MRALAAIVLGGCAAVHSAPPASVHPPDATAAASAGASPAPSPTADRPSEQSARTADDASDDDSDSPGSDFVDWDEAVALRGRTLAQARQWLAARGYHGELAVEESHSDTRCAFDAVCDREPREFHLDQPLTLTITKAKLVIAPPPGRR